LLYDETKRVLEYVATLRNDAFQSDHAQLRFKRSYVTASEIAEQFYCEKSMELAKIYGKELTKEMEKGTQAHDNALKSSVPVTEEESFESIFSGSYVTMREIHLIGKYSDVVIRGKADLIVFDSKNPILIGDYKFKDRPNIYLNELVQTRIYCYLLSCMGFDLSKTRYAIIAPHTDLEDSARVRRLHDQILKQGIAGSKELSFNERMVKLFVKRFEMQEVQKDLDFALGYWLGQREAKPTKNPNKCKSCKFKDRCEFSLA